MLAPGGWGGGGWGRPNCGPLGFVCWGGGYRPQAPACATSTATNGGATATSTACGQSASSSSSASG